MADRLKATSAESINEMARTFVQTDTIQSPVEFIMSL